MVLLKTFPKRHKIQQIEEFEEDTKTAEVTGWFAEDCDQFLTYADTATAALISKMQMCGKPLKDFADVQRGVTPFSLTESPEHPHSRRAFDGTVRRYSIDAGEKRYVRFDESLAEPKPERYFKGPRILLRELISRQFRLQAVKVTEDFVTNKSMQSILPTLDGPDLNYLLGCLNSGPMSWYFLRRSNIAQRDDFPKIVLKDSLEFLDEFRAGWVVEESVRAIGLALQHAVAAPVPNHRRRSMEHGSHLLGSQ